MDDWDKAGEIAKKAREFGASLVKENALALEIANEIEEFIIEQGARPAFPVDVSIDHIAAHSSPFPNDATRLGEGQLVKLDIGVSVNGCIGDTAITVEVGSNDNEKLIKAANEALDAALKIVQPGVRVRDIGAVIHKKIASYGYSPILNLSGHEIKEYLVHAGITIPNYDNGDNRVLEKGMIIAIEPFATNGVGKIKEGKPSGIYALIEDKPIRNFNARKVVKFIEENYKTLPFSVRWLKFPNINFILRILEREGVIKQYNQLPEESKGLVSQAEHTIRVGDRVLT